MNVLFCASEVEPYAKTGGLADVAGSLPLALSHFGLNVRVALPRYRGVEAGPKKISDRVSFHFVEHEAYFNRQGLYGNDKGDYPDNLERFSFFCHTALESARNDGFRPDIVHANDWQTALLPVILKTRLAGDPFFQHARSLLTVHNLAYQGHFPAREFSKLGLDPSLFGVDGFEFYGKINLLKGGILFADGVSTVSPTYAKDICTREYGFGLEGVIERRRKSLRGILNGLDNAQWDPTRDKSLAKPFSIDDLSGKAACKADLQKRCGFAVEADVPVFGIVSRLAEQKGVDMLAEIADRFLSMRAQFVLLGGGDAVYQTAFRHIAKRHPKNAAVFIGFDAVDARRIYAGSDFFLMPSLFEPCGLGQMISFRYGTLPVVRKTGGLADTVKDLDEDALSGNGFCFAEKSGDRLLQTMERAMRFCKDPQQMDAARRRVMKLDFSWDQSAHEFVSFYKDLIQP